MTTVVTDMRTRACPSAALLIVGLSGCIAHGTDADVRAVRTLVSEQASIDFDLGTQSAPLDDYGSVDPAASELAEDAITLDEAIRIALLNNRELRADLFGLGVERGELVQANVFPNPDFEFQVRFSEDDTQPPQWDFGVGIGLTDVILRRGRREAAEAELDAARIRVAAATLDLAYDVRLAYYDVQASQQDLELMRTVLASFVAGYDTARALHEAGNLSDLDLSTEQAAYEDARVAVALAEADVISARERLNVLLGFFGGETSWEISTRLEAPPVDAVDLERLESRAIEASIELAHTRASLIAAARRLGIERAAGLLPDNQRRRSRRIRRHVLGGGAVRDGTPTALRSPTRRRGIAPRGARRDARALRGGRRPDSRRDPYGSSPRDIGA